MFAALEWKMNSAFAQASLMRIGSNLCIEGNGVHCSQTASFTWPLSPLTNHTGLFTERERENTGNQTGRFVVSHLLLDDMRCVFFMACGNDSGAVRLAWNGQCTGIVHLFT